MVRLIPASMAPVRVTTPRKPPIINTNKATSMARASLVSVSYMPLTGAISMEVSRRWGSDSTW